MQFAIRNELLLQFAHDEFFKSAIKQESLRKITWHLKSWNLFGKMRVGVEVQLTSRPVVERLTTCLLN
jgi:hypothetical protein